LWGKKNKKASDDLRCAVDAKGVRRHCAGHVELGETPAGVEEAVSCRAADDLPRVVDAKGRRKRCAGHVELGKAPAGVEEAVGARAVVKSSDDLPRVVDASGRRKVSAGHVELGEGVSGGVCGRPGGEQTGDRHYRGRDCCHAHRPNPPRCRYGRKVLRRNKS
jgi:hypothetical protein